MFFAQNFENIKTNSAFGGGEYLNEFLSSFELNQQQINKLSPIIQKEFEKIFLGDMESSYFELNKILFQNII